MSEKKSPPHKEKVGAGKTTVGDGKSNKRKLIGPGSPLEDEDKKNPQKRKRPNMVDGSSPEHIGMGSPRGAGTVSRLSVPLSERQQMAILMKMADESSVGDTSPKSPSSGNQVSSTTKRTPADKKVNKRNERGEAPLHMAAKRGDYRQTKHLLKAGASVNMKDYAGWTALHEACNLGNIRVARYLLKAGADVNVQGFDDDTPLHDASSNGHRKLVQLLRRHGADPHQSNLKGKTAIDVAATSQIEAILTGNSVNYSSDSGSNSEVSSCDSILSAKEEDRNLEDEFRLHGSQSKIDLVGSSSAVTAVRRQSVPASPDKTASSPRLFMKLQHKKSSSSSSSVSEEQQRVSEWNVLTMETGGCDALLDADVSSNSSRPLEPRAGTSVVSSRLPKPEDSWPPSRHPQSTVGRPNRVGLESDGFPDSTVSSMPNLHSTVPLERSNTEPFTPKTMIPSIGNEDNSELCDVFPTPNSSGSSGATSSCSSTKSSANTSSTSKSFNIFPPICSNSSTSSSSSSSSVNTKQLSPQPHSLFHHAHPHSNSPIRPSVHVLHQSHHKSTHQQPPPQQQSVHLPSGLMGVSGSSSVYSTRDQGHSQPYLPHNPSTKVCSESVVVSTSASPSPLASLSSLPLPHHHRGSAPPPGHYSATVIASTISSLLSSSSSSSVSSLPLSSTMTTATGISKSYPYSTAAPISSSALPTNPSNLSQISNNITTNSATSTTTSLTSSTSSSNVTTDSSRPSPHQQLAFSPFSTRIPKAGGSIVTGLSDRALAACNNTVGPVAISSNMPSAAVAAGGPVPGAATNPFSSSSSSQSPNNMTTTARRDSSSPRISLQHQRVEELALSHPKSDTSSCDSPLCVDMDDNTASDHDSRTSTPKVPPLKIILPGKGVVPSADEYSSNSKPANKPALPYVVNPTREGGGEAVENAEESQGTDTATPSEVENGENVLPPCLPSTLTGPVSTANNRGEGGGSIAVMLDKEEECNEPNWDTASRGSDSRNDQGDMGSNDKSEDGKDKRSTRTLRSHTAMLQQQGKTTERNGNSNSTNDKIGVVELKDEGDNNSTTRSQKGEDSATDESSFPPRKRKLRNKTDAQPSSSVSVMTTTTTTVTITPKIHQPAEKPPNPYETYLNLRRQIANRHRSLCNVPPKPPSGFKDYLMVNCTYVLQGNATSTLSVPMLPPPNLVKEPMREFFIQQEKARYRLRLQHVIEREKLMLSIEQEMLREHGRAARAIANQTLPFSVCTILREEEIYNQQELEQDENRDKNVRSRYNGRQFLSWLQDVDDKYEKIKSLLLLRHHHEAESLYAVQKLDWEWKMKEFGLCDNKNTPVIDDLHVPMVTVSDEFDLLPSS